MLLLSESSQEVQHQLRREFPADAMEDLEEGRAILLVLNQGRFAITDRDFAIENIRHKWVYDGGYVSRVFWEIGKKPRKVYLHRHILSPPAGSDVDHKNLCRLDNRISNLRLCSRSQNNANRTKSASNKSGYKGVYYNQQIRRFIATISVQNKSRYIGCFVSAEEASAAYVRESEIQFGEFSRH